MTKNRKDAPGHLFRNKLYASKQVAGSQEHRNKQINWCEIDAQTCDLVFRIKVFKFGV